MKGRFKVDKLNDSGLFVSDIDWDDQCKDKGNPSGNFAMIVEPLVGFEKGIIYYQKIKGGYLIEGEGHILAGRRDILEKKISEWRLKYKQKKFEFIEKELI